METISAKVSIVEKKTKKGEAGEAEEAAEEVTEEAVFAEFDPLECRRQHT